MAAYRISRKLFEDQSNSTLVVDPCVAECDPVLNPTRNCIPICALFCPQNCNTTYSYSPVPSPPAGEYDISTPSLHHHSSLSLPLKVSLVILVLTFSFFLLYSFYKFYTVWYRSRRRGDSTASAPSRQNGDQEDQETHDEFLDHDVLDHPIWYIRTIGLQPSVISAITVVKYNKLDGLIESTSCSVCLSEFQDDETLRLLPKCNHAFHVPCIDTWLRSHTNCPLCRAGIVKNTNTTNSDDLGQTEETHIAISIPDNEGETPREDVNNQSSDLTIRVIDEDENNKGEIIGGSGTNDFIIMRRSVSLNDYEACRIRSDIQSNNNYYSDRHNVQIQPVSGNLGFEVVKVDRTVNNRAIEH